MTDPAPVLDLIDAFRKSKTMFTAVKLGIFDRLAEAPRDLKKLAAATGSNADALERLLDACVGLGFLRRDQGVYANQPVAAAYLASASEHSMAGYILYSNDALYPLWGNLEDAIREGTHRWKQTFADEGGIFAHLFRTDEAMRAFLMGMHGFGVMSSPKVVAAMDLSRFRKLVDLGGATGHLTIAACERYPALRGLVFDLPRVIVVARERVEKSSARDRIEVLAGDFFADELPEADLYAVGRILHDWSEEKIHKLLGKIFKRLPAGGGLLIAEKLLAEDRTGPVTAQLQSLNMLVCTEGKERTLGEYEALLRQTGFASVEGRSTGAPVDAVLAVK
jgi:acetylserotonin O-methyltransferase